MTEPLVSILMPTYRRPHYLQNSLATAVGQTYRNLEIIVRDNASGDETPNEVRSFSDPRIVFLQAKSTVSPTENCNECLNVATGKFCLMLSDDDEITRNYVEDLAGALERDDDISIAYSSGRFIDQEGNNVGQVSPQGSYCMDSMSFLMAMCQGSLPLTTVVSMVMRTGFMREVISQLGQQRFPEGHNSDNASSAWMALRGKVYFSDQATYSYRLHQGNTSHRLSNSAHLAGDRAMIEFLAEQSEATEGNRLSREEWRRLRRAARFWLARTYFSRAVDNRLAKQSLLTKFTDFAIGPTRVFGPAVVVYSWIRIAYHFLRSRRHW